MYGNAFLIKRLDITHLLKEKNTVFARWAFEGIHKGDFFHFKASSHPVHLTGQSLYSFNEEGKIAEVWQSWDTLGLLRQIQRRKDDLMGFASCHLSKRERQCLSHLLLGKTAKETASLLQISFRTVEYYFENLKDKLGCFSKRELYAHALFLEKQGIL